MSVKPLFSIKKVEDQLIAGIRFKGTYRDIHLRIEELQLLLNRLACGSPMCLYFNGRTGVADMEVAFPVSRALNNPDIKCHVLEGRHYLTLNHKGVYGPPDVPGSMSDSWAKMGIYLRDHEVNLETGPIREIYVEGFQTHRNKTARYVTELQVPVLLPAWLDRFTEGVAQNVNKSEVTEICSSKVTLRLETLPSDQSLWVKGALDKLTEVLPDPTIRKKILTACAHRYPNDDIAHLRKAYLRLGNVESLLDFMRLEVAEGRAYYAIPEKRGHLLHMEKVPWDAERMKNATSEAERRACHCHCGLVRAAILNSQTIDPIFCNCGAGWLKQLWEGILKRSVDVTLMESVLNGSDRCYFIIDVSGA